MTTSMATLLTGMVLTAASGSAETRFSGDLAAQGRTRRALEAATGRLCAPPLSDPDFVLADLDFRLTRRFTEYSGDISGRMIGALQAAGPLLGRSIRLVEQIASAVEGLQKPDGHFGADQDLAAGVTQSRDMPLLWGNGRLLLALCERYRLTKDRQLLEIARRLGDYCISTRPHYGREENFRAVGGVYASGYTTCYPSLIDGLAALGEVSGQARYMDEAQFIARLSLLDAEFAGHHSHGRLTAYRGMLDIDRFTGTPAFRETVVAGCRTIRRDLMLPTGGISETFDRDAPVDEGCSEADWIRVNFFLWQATGEPEYLDVAEHALRNHLLAMQYRNGGFGHRPGRTLRSGQQRWPWGGVGYTGAEAYWCCSMHGTQLLADVVRWSVVESGGKLWITWLGEAQGRFDLPGGPVEVLVHQGAPGRWEVRLTSSPPQQVALRLRVPGWAGSIGIDGRQVAGEHGWADVAVPVDGPTTLHVAMPVQVRVAGVYADEVAAGEPVRLFSGPDLLCLADADVPDGLLAEDEVPEVLYEAEPTADGTVRAIVRKGDREVATRLRPMADRPPGGCRWLFSAKAAPTDLFGDAPELYRRNEVPIEVVLCCDGDYVLYVNGKRLAAAQGYVQSLYIDAHVPRGRNVLAVKVHSTSSRPGLMGMVELPGGRRLFTNARGWQAWLWPASGDVSAPQTGADPVELEDLGGFGADPWKHMNGEFAGTEARWVWPKESRGDVDKAWLLRTEFQVESP